MATHVSVQLPHAGGPTEAGYAPITDADGKLEDWLAISDDIASVSESGSTAIGNGATTVAVVFDTVQANTSYGVLFSFENTVDATPLFPIGIVTTKATTGFTVTLDAATDGADYILKWLVVRDTPA